MYLIQYSDLMILLVLMLIVIVIIDIVSFKIPNFLVFIIAFFGLVGQLVFWGFEGLLDGGLGLVCGLLIFIPFYIKGCMGAGDVKLMAAIGCTLGIKITLFASLYTLIAGGFIALLWLAVGGELITQLRRYFLMSKTFICTRQMIYINPEDASISLKRFPYSLAIVSGTFIALFN
ncbi:MAG: prepilin peptidase [Pseudomonadales bacterium]|nr:prepilin peptidase [Pseudomonadales bacterium]